MLSKFQRYSLIEEADFTESSEPIENYFAKDKDEHDVSTQIDKILEKFKDKTYELTYADKMLIRGVFTNDRDMLGIAKLITTKPS